MTSRLISYVVVSVLAGAGMACAPSRPVDSPAAETVSSSLRPQAVGAVTQPTATVDAGMPAQGMTPATAWPASLPDTPEVRAWVTPQRGVPAPTGDTVVLVSPAALTVAPGATVPLIVRAEPGARVLILSYDLGTVGSAGTRAVVQADAEGWCASSWTASAGTDGLAHVGLVRDRGQPDHELLLPPTSVAIQVLAVSPAEP